MRCAECRLLISKYVDGEISQRDKEFLEAHIAQCPQCLRTLADYQLINSRFTAFNQYQTDPQARRRLLAALHNQEQRVEEVHITRRQSDEIPVLRPPSGYKLGGVFGSVATGFAMLVVLATGLVIWQMRVASTGAQPATASDAWPASIPTNALQIAEVPNAEATVQAAIAQVAPRGPGEASPTAPWRPAAEPTDTAAHTVRDERFGYEFTYPANWWTSRVAVTDTATTAQRVIKPWPVADDNYDPRIHIAISISVHDNNSVANPADVAQEFLADQPYSQTVISKLPAIQSSRVADNLRSEDVLILQSQLVYQLELALSADDSVDEQSLASAWPDALAAFEQLLASFEPGQQMLADDPGAAPLLFLNNADLWLADMDQDTAKPVATASAIIDFAVAPDLTRVALVGGATRKNSAWGQYIEIAGLNGQAAQKIWTQDEVHDVIWYDTQTLLAIGSGPSVPFGIYYVDPTTGASRSVALLDHSFATARNLQVSPDKLWITFISGEGAATGLYRVSKDGGKALAMLTGKGVTDYGWLNPASDSDDQKLLVLSKDQVGYLVAPSDSRLAPKWQALAGQPGGASLAVSLEGAAAYLTQANNSAVITLIKDTISNVLLKTLDAGLNTNSMPTEQTALGWLANSRYLAVQEKTANAQPTIKLLDLDTQRMTNITALAR